MKTSQIRQKFIDYFVNEGHASVPGSPLIPAQDPTLMFTNAGMVQFKDVFLGKEKRPYTCCVTNQRCLRAGGKHNDLENVGRTARHHTFFEMLGNFSFTAYFKEKAMELAWRFLTEELSIAKDRLLVTVFETDDEAYALWRDKVGVPDERIIRCGEKDNFWSMGETGPCGPCSEIFYDHGPSVSGGPPGSVDADGDRFVEVWNLVFMQYNRDAKGVLTDLPNPAVDTGMGLERIAAVMQGVHDNYEIDLFVDLISAIKQKIQPVSCSNVGLRVIADHLRSITFMIFDQVRPSNESRGYVLRRIIRRAMRFAVQSGVSEPFLFQCIADVVAIMKDGYPELVEQQAVIEKIVRAEEELFLTTLSQGMSLFSEMIKEKNIKKVPGEIVFKLHDTYGFPVDLTEMMAKEKGLSLDIEGYTMHLNKQKERSKQAHQFRTKIDQLPLDVQWHSTFLGYEQWNNSGEVLGLFVDNKPSDKVEKGQEAVVVLDKTVCYAESGGQVGDQGIIQTKTAEFIVEDTQKQNHVTLHFGRLLSGFLKTGERVEVQVDERRKKTILNHSATHLLHAALRKVLGTHVVQKGSLVASDRLRFDFAHSEPITSEQKYEVERWVNRWIGDNQSAQVKEMAMADAQKVGAMALFGEKYGATVRVVQFGDESIELCGGTHVQATGEIGSFRILSENGIASGVRRIEAATGERALDFAQQQDMRLNQLASLLKTNTDQLESRVEQILSSKGGKKTGGDHLSATVEKVRAHYQSLGVCDLMMTHISLPGSDLRELIDVLKKTTKDPAVWILVADGSDRRPLVCGVHQKLKDRVNAREILNIVTSICGGKGGGRSDFAQGALLDYGKWEQAKDAVVKTLKEE